jgi:hypothetical protein
LLYPLPIMRAANFLTCNANVMSCRDICLK